MARGSAGSAGLGPPPDAGPRSGDGPGLRRGWGSLHPILRSEIGFALVGLVLGAVLAFCGAPPIVAACAFALVALILPVIVLVIGLPVLVHELGHLLAARRLGFEVVGFDVLGVSFMRGGSRELGTHDPFGFVQVRTTLAQDRAEAWRPFILAGPGAGIAFTAVEAAFVPLASPHLIPILLIHVLNGLWLNVGSLIPKTTRGGWTSDGEKLRDVRQPDSQTFARTAFARVAESLSRGDVRGMAPEDLRRAMLSRDPLVKAHTAGAACYRAILEGTGAVEAARAYLRACDEALETSPDAAWRAQTDTLRRDAIHELTFAQAIEAHDAREAEQTLSLLDVVEPRDFHDALRVDAALAWAQGDDAETARRLARARAHLTQQRESEPSPVWDVAEEFLALLESPLTPSPSPPEGRGELRSTGSA